jgi:uncharacterized membrane protein
LGAWNRQKAKQHTLGCATRGDCLHLYLSVGIFPSRKNSRAHTIWSELFKLPVLVNWAMLVCCGIVGCKLEAWSEFFKLPVLCMSGVKKTGSLCCVQLVVSMFVGLCVFLCVFMFVCLSLCE